MASRQNIFPYKEISMEIFWDRKSFSGPGSDRRHWGIILQCLAVLKVPLDEV